MSTERRRIERILALVAKYPAHAASGLEASTGLRELDDCAVVPFSAELDLVAGSDFVRGEGFYLFQLGIINHFDIGYYLVAANASDLAAMGASPLGILVAFRYSPTMTDQSFDQVMSGVTYACSELRMPLLGGDTGSYEASVLSATALGTCPKGRALRRSGARDGDILFISGTVGSAGAAIAYFLRARPAGCHLTSEEEAELSEAWRRVRPALSQGQFLVERQHSRCAIDTSDGLKAACRQLAESSNVSVLVEAKSIPFSPTLQKVAAFLGINPVDLALSDSVDFRLLFTVPPASVGPVEEAFRQHGWPLFKLGRIARTTSGGQAFLVEDGRCRELPGHEWSQEEDPTVDSLMRRP